MSIHWFLLLCCQAMRDDLQVTEPLVDTCRKTADKLGSICGVPGTVEIQKHLEDMDGLVEDIQDGVKDRDMELGQALERSENCSRYHEAVVSWLPKLEDQLNRMSAPATDVKILQAQITEIKNFKANALDHRSDVANLNQYAAALKNASPITAESLVAEVKELSDRWYGLLGAIGDRERALNLKLIDSGSVDVAINGVVELLTLSQEELADIRAVKGDGKVLENALKNLQVKIYNEIIFCIIFYIIINNLYEIIWKILLLFCQPSDKSSCHTSGLISV